MTIETERPKFRGVVCLHCKAPIPIPSIVGSLLVTPNEGLASSGQKSQVFTVRCSACYKEKPYRTKEIIDFEGTAEEAALPARAAPIRWYPQDGITKAAKA